MEKKEENRRLFLLQRKYTNICVGKELTMVGKNIKLNWGLQHKQIRKNIRLTL